MSSTGALPIIARWWRRSGRSARGGEGIERIESTHPGSILLNIMRSDDGKGFIRDQVAKLRLGLQQDDDPEQRFLLALFLEKLGDKCLRQAVQEMTTALAALARRRQFDLGWARSEAMRLGKALWALEERQEALAALAADDGGRVPRGKRKKIESVVGWGQGRGSKIIVGPSEGVGQCLGAGGGSERGTGRECSAGS
ncbi:unnamed protein product, partial [Discosporangium mesarthrocarpum]